MQVLSVRAPVLRSSDDVYLAYYATVRDGLAKGYVVLDGVCGRAGGRGFDGCLVGETQLPRLSDAACGGGQSDHASVGDEQSYAGVSSGRSEFADRRTSCVSFDARVCCGQVGRVCSCGTYWSRDSGVLWGESTLPRAHVDVGALGVEESNVLAADGEGVGGVSGVQQSEQSGKVVDAESPSSSVGRTDGAQVYVVPGRRGPNGGVSYGRGSNYERNQCMRDRKKKTGRRRVSSTFGACTQEERDNLQKTRAARFVAENQLRTFEVCRKLELAKAQDFDLIKQQQRTQLLRQTELNKVQIEKAHGSLSGEIAGSVPTVVGGTVETVLTGGSISPSSSISEAEIRKLHKDFLDSQAEVEKLKKDNYKLRFGVHQEDGEGRPDDDAPWDGGEDSVSQDQFSYRSGYMCTPEQREANKKLALELRGW